MIYSLRAETEAFEPSIPLVVMRPQFARIRFQLSLSLFVCLTATQGSRAQSAQTGQPSQPAQTLETDQPSPAGGDSEAAADAYLALGGLAFLLGDGALTYGPETIFEGFYTTHIWRGFFASFDIQHVNNPGYNMARGPVTVPSLRLHIDF
jgi:hypothetical protein